ncbi:MAG TPA: c-type cytochrome [Arenimonas sp.]|nr:c-type cytochrome [Arenimonas sp.]
MSTPLLLALLLGPSLAQAYPQPVRPAKLGLCVACHGVDGRSRAPGTPHINGQDRVYLQRALTDYRSGARKSNPMSAIAGTLQPRDIEQMAAWYSAQPGFTAP